MSELPIPVESSERVLLFRRIEFFHVKERIVDGQIVSGERHSTWEYIAYLEDYIKKTSRTGLLRNKELDGWRDHCANNPIYGEPFEFDAWRP